MSVLIGPRASRWSCSHLVQRSLLAISFSTLPLQGFCQAGAAQQPQNIVIETITGGDNRYHEIAGTWGDSYAKSTAPWVSPRGKVAARKCVFSSNQPGQTVSPGPAIARFTPKLAAAGHYYVYVTWPEWANAQPVEYVIKHAHGQASRTVKQDGFGTSGPSSGSKWILLGDFDLEAGDASQIEMRIDEKAQPVNQSKLGQVYADAVCLSSQLIPDSISWESVAMQGASSAPAAPPAAASQPAPPSYPNLAAVGNSAQPATPAPLEWVNNLSQAQSRAEQQNKRILLFFDNAQAKRARYFHALFEDPQVSQLLKDYILVRLDYISNTEVANRLSVFAAGTIVIYDSHGTALNKINQQIDAQELIRNLKGK